jgi:hypothetical protein
MRHHLASILILIGALACVPGGRDISELDTSNPELAEETSALAQTFNEAADRFGVPRDVLKAIAYRETQFVDLKGDVDFDGQPASYGHVALRGAELDRAAEMLGRTAAEIQADAGLLIEAAAALLSSYGAQIPDADRANISAWAPAIAKYGELSAEFRAGYVSDVLRVVKKGRVVKLEDGSTIVIRPGDLDSLGEFATTASGLGAGNSVWRPSPNYNSRSGSGVELVVIHSCEGNYGGCVGWLRNTQAQASAHYVVKEDGAEIAQLVDENSRAWHVAAAYRPRLNENMLPGRSGQSVNTFSVGIEHAGFASQRSWSEGLLASSVDLVRGITERHGIPRDRYHVVSHGQLQPESRTDPGPNWPWSNYLERIQGTPEPPPPPPPGDGKFFVTGNFDGIGGTDWSWFAPWTHDFIVMTSDGDGTWTDHHTPTTNWGEWSEMARHFSTGDYNGDGKTDWSWYAFWTNDFIVMLSNGDGTWSEVHNDTSDWGNWADGRHFQTGDFDGDAKTDWSWYAPWTNDFIVMLSNGDGTYKQIHNDTSSWGNWSDAKFTNTGDFDGDGATDWAWVAPGSNEFVAMLSARDGSYFEVRSSADWGDWSKGASNFAVGDFDGNKIADWSWYAPWTDDFIVMLGSGDGTFAEKHNSTAGWGNWAGGRHFSSGDFDGDGDWDWSWYAYWTNDFIVMLSNGDGSYREVHNDTARFGNWGDGKHFRTGDFDANGTLDWSWYAPWTNDHLVFLSDGNGAFLDVHNDTSGWGKF